MYKLSNEIKYIIKVIFVDYIFIIYIFFTLKKLNIN